MRPLIAIFHTPNHYYVYDAIKDELLTISGESFKYLNAILSDNISIPNPPYEILELKSKGYLNNSVVKNIRHIYSDYLEVFLERKVTKMTLQLTQDCNFRCKYCIYSEENKHQRSHSKKKMTWATAKKAIDFLRSHSIDSPSVNVGFYGGEPLLEFNLLRRIMEYCNDCFIGKELTFNITTNGTLLTDEKIYFLKEHDVSLMISLDGPKEINDSNRIFSDGRGTFDTVLEQINHIKEIVPDYMQKLQISMVMNPENDFDCINELCIDGSDLSKISLSPSLVEKSSSNKNAEISEKYAGKMAYHNFLSILSRFNRYPADKVSPIADRWLEQVLDDQTKICTGAALNTVDAPSGPCIPGQLRLFVKNHQDIGVVVSSIFDESDKSWETLFLTRTTISDKNNDKHLTDIVNKALKVGKAVVYYDDYLYGVPENIMKLSSIYSDKLAIITEDKKQHTIKRMSGYYCSITTPVVLIGGLTATEDTFEVLVALSEELRTQGLYAVAISKHCAIKMLGCRHHCFAHIINKKTTTEVEKIEALNGFIRDIEQLEMPDVILLEAPDSIMRYSNMAPNGFGILTYMLCQAVTPDYFICCVPYDLTETKFLSAINDDLSIRLGVSIDAVHVSNVVIDSANVLQTHKVTQVHINMQKVQKLINAAEVNSIIPLFDIVTDGAKGLCAHLFSDK